MLIAFGLIAIYETPVDELLKALNAVGDPEGGGGGLAPPPWNIPKGWTILEKFMNFDSYLRNYTYYRNCKPLFRKCKT